MNQQAAQSPLYVLGHSELELQRHIVQSHFQDDLTAQVFRSAGLGSGMRVLDVGCGPGDVSFLAAKFVGAAGTVIGIDRSPESIAMAQARAAKTKLHNVWFRKGELDELTLEQPVDAAVGRLVLMYSVSPAATLRRIASQVRPGGLIIFHEMDMTSARCLPASNVFDRCLYWITETFKRGKVELQMGLKLHQAFRRAGLPAPQLTAAARIETGPHSQVYKYIAETVRSLLPMMVRFGVATREEVWIETLAERLRQAAISNDSVIVAPLMIGAWTLKPRQNSPRLIAASGRSSQPRFD